MKRSELIIILGARTLILSIIIWGFCACTNPFSTRTPEEPNLDPGQIVYSLNDKPESVLSNFILSYQDKNLSQNMDLFSRSVEKPYRFNPEPQLVNQYQGSWTIIDEQEYFNKLIASERKGYPQIQLRFLVPIVFTGISQPSPVDSVISNTLSYELQVDYGDSVATYTGDCLFKLYENPEPPNYWSIYYWQDNARNGKFNQSWSYLKIFVHGK